MKLFSLFYIMISNIYTCAHQVVPQNGHKKKEESNGEDKKHRKHRKKSSRHESTFVSLFNGTTGCNCPNKLDLQEKFRKLEKKEKSEEGDDFRGKKIHVRSKDPSKIARQFEKSDKGKQGVGRAAPKVVFALHSSILEHTRK